MEISNPWMAVLSLVLAGFASAGTGAIVVDDDGGPGVDFTDIQAAVDAAPQNGLVRIFAGQYSAFTIDGKKLTLIGEPGANVAGGSVVTNLSPFRRVVLSRLKLASLAVVDCQATVYLDDVDLDESADSVTPGAVAFLVASRSADVRLRESRVGLTAATPGVAGVFVDEARVELASCDVRGAFGADWDDQPGAADSGTAGLRARNASRVHVARSDARGGTGGNDLELGDGGGRGGDGLRLEGQTMAFVAGDGANVAAGGEGGASVLNVSGDGGDGVHLVSGGANALRVSDQILVGAPGAPDSADGHALWTGFGGDGGTVTQPALADPTLEIIGDPKEGSPTPILFRLHGPPGTGIGLKLGRTTLVTPTPGIEIEELLVPLRNFDLGTMPASGFVDLPFLAGAFPAGTIVAAQGTLDYGGGDLRRSNSTLLVVDFDDAPTPGGGQ